MCSEELFRGCLDFFQNHFSSKIPAKNKFRNISKFRLKSEFVVMRDEDFEIIEIFHVRNPDEKTLLNT